jgi:plastocyanin
MTPLRSLIVGAALLAVATACGDDGGNGTAAPAATTTAAATTPAATSAAPTTESTSAPATTSAPAAAQAKIVTKGFQFMPATLTVAPGTEITFDNEDTAPHDATSSANPPAFKSKTIVAGEGPVTFAAPDQAGDFDYICSVHPRMKGKLIVQ